jgi:hypothetical protein
VRGQKMALWILPVCRHVRQGQKPMCHLCGGNKIELKKMCGGENKKYISVGNECRLTRCLFAICSVCWSPVKMVYFFLVIVSRFVVVVSSNTLAGNVPGLAEGGDFLHKSSIELLLLNLAQMPNRST